MGLENRKEKVREKLKLGKEKIIEMKGKKYKRGCRRRKAAGNLRDKTKFLLTIAFFPNVEGISVLDLFHAIRISVNQHHERQYLNDFIAEASN